MFCGTCDVTLVRRVFSAVTSKLSFGQSSDISVVTPHSCVSWPLAWSNGVNTISWRRFCMHDDFSFGVLKTRFFKCTLLKQKQFVSSQINVGLILIQINKEIGGFGWFAGGGRAGKGFWGDHGAVRTRGRCHYYSLSGLLPFHYIRPKNIIAADQLTLKFPPQIFFSDFYSYNMVVSCPPPPSLLCNLCCLIIPGI